MVDRLKISAAESRFGGGPDLDVRSDPEGDYVDYADYKALEERLNALQAKEHTPTTDASGVACYRCAPSERDSALSTPVRRHLARELADPPRNLKLGRGLSIQCRLHRISKLMPVVLRLPLEVVEPLDQRFM
jgi:hypothetical protein